MGIAGIFAGWHSSNRETGRQHRWHVFGRMYRSVYAPGQQRLLDLLGEQAFAAYFRERPVANEISSRADDFEPD